MTRLFFCHFLLSVFALGATTASASPMVAQIGAARATLTLSPDPPSTGAVHGVVTIDGAPPEALARTDVTYGSAMPVMSMRGPSGTAYRNGPGRWAFDASLGMATTWAVSLRFSGGLNGTVTYRFAVAGNDSGSSMSGVVGMSSAPGDPNGWRYAALALVVILIAGVLVLVVHRDRRPLTLAIVLGSGILVIVLAAVQARFAAPPMDMTAMTSIQGDAPTPVTLAPVRTSGYGPQIHAPGSIAPYLMQDVVTRAAGILTYFTLYAGEKVAAGQVIALLDAPDLQSRAAAAASDAASQAATAQAAEIEAHHHAPNGVVIARADTAALQQDLSAAQADYAAKGAQARYWANEVRREKILLDQGAVSVQEYQDEQAQSAAAGAAYTAAAGKVGSTQQQLDASRTKAEDAVASVAQMQARAAAAQAQAQKARSDASTEATLAGYTTVTNPAGNAIVVKRLIDPGVYVAVGTPILRIAETKRLRVQANVAQEDLAVISLGTPVDARLQDGSVVHGRVSSVAPIADATTHTATVEAIVDNARPDLVPGGFVQVTLYAQPIHAAGGVEVPSSAVIGAGADSAIWTDVNGTAHRISVHVVSDDGTTATVTGDLTRRTRVVVQGADTLEEGQPITQAQT